MNRAWAGIALGCLAVGGMPLHAQTVAEFTHVLGIAQKGGDGLQRVMLPALVHQGSARSDLGDLRVFNTRGELLPFAHAGVQPIAKASPATLLLPFFPLTAGSQRNSGSDTLSLQVRQQKDGTLVSLNSSSGRTGKEGSPIQRRDLTGYIVDASRLSSNEGNLDLLHMAALVFEWDVNEDSRSGRVRIESSDDLRSWSTLVMGSALVDLEHGGQRLTQKRVEVMPGAARYLRITWLDKPFELKSITAEIQPVRVSPTLARQIVVGDPGKSEGQQQAEHVYDLVGRFPVEEVNLLLPEANSVAPVRIFARSESNQPWQQVGSATFYRLNRDGVELVAPPIRLARRNERFWKIVVDSRGGTGGGAPRLEVAWQPASIIFVARGEGPYRLAWGNADAAPANLSLATLMPGYREDSEYSLPLAEVGELTRQTIHPPSAMEKLARTFTWKQSILWLVLLGGVGFLGVMAWRLSAQLGASKEGKSMDGKRKDPV